MPKGLQSLIPFTSTVFTSQIGTTYKGNIDADTSVISNTAGALYVFPIGGMSVGIDTGFNIPISGSGSAYFLNGGNVTPAGIVLAAPGSLSYYCTVYWDYVLNIPGVVYGAVASSPVPILPDSLKQAPLAFVLIASTTTTITANLIQDVRYSRWPSTVSSFINLAVSSINCDNAATVNISFSCPASSATIALVALSVGAQVNLIIQNNSGAARLVTVAASTPSGAAYGVVNITGATGPVAFTSLSISNLTGIGFIGATILEGATPKLYFKG